MTTADTLQGLRESLGVTDEMLRKSQILVVGAGGIGCELLKNLALCGFANLQVIDLDTIDTSNLNRQLLFRAPHVGQPKCVVGVQVAARMAPYNNHNDNNHDNSVQYKAHHGNVCDNELFHVPFVQQFDLVLNALDNVTARRRVNRLCLAARVPMIEAGTTGYLGQVQVVQPHASACYECKTQEPPKVYPICTIRSTPSRPVHTIVWAKELYKLLLGDDPVQSMLYEGDGEQENVSNNENNDEQATNAAGEPSTFMGPVRAYRQDPTSATAVQAVIEALYVTEIQKQLDMDRYKAAEKTPTVLDLTTTEAPQLPATWNPLATWSVAECLAELTRAMLVLDSNDRLPPTFDKDDEASMRFVTAAANLRSANFQIPMQSYHATKGIAGNIIPAIATTNAIVAGLQILQVFAVLGDAQKTKEQQQQENSAQQQTDTTPPVGAYINVLRQPTRNGLYLAVSPLEKPNPNCYACGNATIQLALKNNHQATLGDFVQQIAKDALGLAEPSVHLGNITVWEEGAGADTEAVVAPTTILAQLPAGGLQHGTVVTLEDFSQDLTLDVCVFIPETWEHHDDDDEWHFQIVGQQHKAPPKVAATTTTTEPATTETKSATNEEATNDDDAIEIVEAPVRKRPAQDEETPEQPAKKKQRQEEVIEID